MLNKGGWDHHNNQEPNQAGGQMYDLMAELSGALDSFWTDLSQIEAGTGLPYLDRVTVVVVSEFGRRVAENNSKGTDHGRGNMAMVLGGSHVNGGQVYDRGWQPGGIAANLDAQGEDLLAHIDWRDIVAEVLIKKFGTPNIADVFFSGYQYNPLGIVT